MPYPVLPRLSLPALLLAALSINIAPGQEEDRPSVPQRNVADSLQPFVNRHILAGAVTLVASKDKILQIGAVGYADVAAKKPMHTDDLFWIASMSKPITAAALMMLVDEGQVHVDDPVEKYLPEFHGQMVAVEEDADHVLLKKPAHPITVRNLLTHTSGLPFMSRVEHRIDTLPLREAVLSYALSPLKFGPGTRYEYSNAGINTVGRIIEVVSGMPYEEFLQKRLLKPLGMKDTTFRPTEAQVQRLARSYKAKPGHSGLEEIPINQLTYPLTSTNRYPCPAGGLFSTAADLSCFCRMILAQGIFEGRRYLSPEAIQQMTTTQTPDKPGMPSYGFGWSVEKSSPGGKGLLSPGSFGHGGAYSTQMWIDPQKQLVLVLLVQHAGFPDGEGGKMNQAIQRAAVDQWGR
ncbi:MAG: beta-lactamase family protein [Planctomycetes bacterium]|nr:beta-lactamase family protein [Planctomycetota bacterium]